MLALTVVGTLGVRAAGWCLVLYPCAAVPRQAAGAQAAAADQPAGGAPPAAEAPGADPAAPRNPLLSLLRELQLFVVGFITSLLPGFQPPDLQNQRRAQQPRPAPQQERPAAGLGNGDQRPHAD